MTQSKRDADYLKKCRERVEASKKWRQTNSLDALWARLIDLYAGKHFDFNGMGDEDRIAVNISFASINVIYPSVSVTNPKFTLLSSHPDSADSAVIAEAVLNYEWRHNKMQPEFRRAVKDFLIIGHGWLKTGYKFSEKEQPRSPADIQAEAAQRYGEVNDLVAQDPSVATLVPTDEEIAASIPQTHTVVTEDRPFADRVSPFDMFVDQTATSMSDLRWLAQRIIMPLEAAKNDPTFIKSVRSQLRGSTTAASTEDPSSKRFGTEKGGEEFVTVWEYYDCVNETMCKFADGCEGWLVKPRSMPYSFGHPYKMIRNYDIPDQFYPMGDLENVEQLQYELNLTRSALMNDRKRYKRKTLYREKNFSKDGIEALESADENILVPVIGSEPFAEVIAAMPVQQPLSELYNQSEMIKADFSEILALSEYQRGALPNIRRTATEASVIADAANARASEKLSTIEEGLAEVGSNLMQLLQTYMTGEKVAHIVGKGGDQLWFHYDNSYIAGEFDFSIEAGSTQPNNESFRRQSAMQLMDAMSQFIPLGVVNVQELIRYVLQDGFGVKNPQRFTQQPPPPMAPPGVGGPPGMPPAAGMPPGLPPDMNAPPKGTPVPSGGGTDPFANQYISIGGA